MQNSASYADHRFQFTDEQSNILPCPEEVCGQTFDRLTQNSYHTVCLIKVQPLHSHLLNYFYNQIKQHFSNSYKLLVIINLTILPLSGHSW